MMSEVTHIDFTDFTEALPAFLTIPSYAFNIQYCLKVYLLVLSLYTLIKLTTGRRHEIHPIMYIMTLAFYYSLCHLKRLYYESYSIVY